MMNINMEYYFQSHPCPIWIVDLDKHIQFVNRKFEELFNMKFRDLNQRKISGILPEEIGIRVDEAIDRVLKTLKSQILRLGINHKYYQYEIFPIVGENSEVSAVAGNIEDITEEVFNEKELENGKNILRTIIDALPEMIFYKDKNLNFLGYNKKFSQFYDRLGINSLIGKSDLQIYPDKKKAVEFINEDNKIIDSKTPQYIVKCKNDNGREKYEESLKVPVLSDSGEVLGVVGLSRDITKQKLLERKLKYLSYTDILTGAYNRTYFEEKLNELRNKKVFPLGVIMGDVNGLKIINDSLGHIEGDRLLKKMAEVLQDACESRGEVFRWGGDEFMMLIPSATEEICKKVVDEIEDACNNERFDYIDLSISLGVTIVNDENTSDYEIVKQAEEKVYRNKLLGRNAVRSTMMNSLITSIMEKNMETAEHTERVIKYCEKIGRKMNLGILDMEELLLAAKLHDIGKIGIDEKILFKKDKLTKEEYEIVKTHSEKGYRIINTSSEFGNVAKCVLTHHERWDGNGYPLGISGREIPIIARIIAVADAYDVMTNNVIYAKIKTKDEAVEELKKCSGKQFDPDVVKIFVEYLSET